MKILNIVTPCSRLHNLHRIHESIFNGKIPPDLTVKWWVILDFATPVDIEFPGTTLHYFFTYGKGTVGHDQRNYALKYLPLAGHVKFLDDDTIVHPDYYKQVAPHLGTDKIIVVDQVLRNDELRLIAKPGNVQPDFIDTDQYTFPALLAGDIEFPLVYNGDGYFIQSLHKRHRGNFVFINKPASYYNYLR